MSITVNLLTFKKRPNSTKVPTAAQIAAGASYGCTLLESTSLMNPTFKLSIGSNPIDYNYCYVADFHRYYFVRDITSDNNFWYITCEVDPMASHKTEVLAGSHYVLRSASQRDEYILDTIYPSKIKETGQLATGSVDGTAATDPFSYSNGHSYVWCITGDVISDSLTNQQIGSNVYYWMNDRECYTFINYLLDVQQYSGIDQTTEYSQAMQKALMNPLQYVNAVILLPFGKNDFLATNNDVQFGYYTITVQDEDNPPSIKRLTHGTMIKSQVLEITLPKHPQAASIGKYMNNAPYTSYELFMGPFGTIPIDPASLIDETTLYVTIRTECCTGQCQLFVRGKTSNVMIYSGTAQSGVPVTISQLTRDMLGEIQNNLNMQYATAGALTSVAMGGLGAAGGVFNSIQSIGGMAFDAVRLQYPTLAGGGASGSFISQHSSCYLNAKFYEVVGQNNTELGRPLYQTKTLNTLSGFCVCSGADATVTGTAAEVEQINNYLNSGFFIE